MGGGKQTGPVNYDLARQLASSSIGFVAPSRRQTTAAIADAVRLAETWLDGVTALPAGTTKAAAWTPNDWIDNTLDTWKRLCDPSPNRFRRCGRRRCPRKPGAWRARCCR